MSKRATLPRMADYTKAFVKDWQRLTHSGRYNMQQLKEVMLLLIANDAPCPLNGWIMPCWVIGATTGSATLVVIFC